MGKRAFIFAAVLVALLIGGVAAVYAYDSGRDDLIAKGVTVAGLDVGDMRRSQATELLQRRLADKIERDIVVRYDKRRFRLSPRAAHVRTLVARVAKTVRREPKNASVAPSAGGLQRVASHTGVELASGYLLRRIRK